MYQILLITPGICHYPKAESGKIIEVSCAIDQKFHSSVKVVLCELEGEKPDCPEGTVRGYFDPETMYVTFSYTSTHHWKLDFEPPPNWSIPEAPIMVGFADSEQTYVFKNTSFKVLYHSNGAE